MGADRESGVVAINAIPRVGQTLQFQYRDAQAAGRRPARSPDGVCARRWSRRKKCSARCSAHATAEAAALFGEPDHDASALSEIFGPVPTAGFFCNGEIGPVGGENYLHGFTASIAVLTSHLDRVD